MLIPSIQFMPIYKQYGIHLTLDSQRVFFDFMSLGGNRTTFNLEMLAKLFHVLAKLNFRAASDASRVHYEPKVSAMERFRSNLESKLAIAFPSAEDLLRFMDLSASESVRIEEFLFCVQFFVASVDLALVIMLFKQLDSNGDGVVELADLQQLMPNREG